MVDDRFGDGLKAFLNDEEAAARRFKHMLRVTLSERSARFNGLLIPQATDNSISLGQIEKIGRLT